MGQALEKQAWSLGDIPTRVGRMKWREGGRKPGVGIEPEAKGGARASKRRKKSALARSLNPLSNNPSPWQGAYPLFGCPSSPYPHPRPFRMGFSLPP